MQRCVITQGHNQKNQGEQEVKADPSDDPSLQSSTTAKAPDVVHQRKGHAGGEFN